MTHEAVEKQKRSVFKKVAPYLALTVLLAASVWISRFLADAETTRARNHFNEYCQRISRNITDRLYAYKMILQGGAGVFVASEEMTRDEWRTYYDYRQIRTLYPGIHGMGFSKVIAPSELARHVESIRAEGYPDYTVRPDGERDIYMPVIFLEPFDASNRRAFGYDPFSEPVRRAAMERARDTGMVAMSGSVHLVQETDEDIQKGFLIFVPVFDKGMPLNGVEDRRAALTGYVHGAFRIKDLMQGIFPYQDPLIKVAFEIYDGAEVLPEALLFASRELVSKSSKEHKPRFSSRSTLELYGHTWALDFRSTPFFEAGQAPHLSWIILAAGLAVSILVFLLMRSQQNTVAKAHALAEELSASLRENRNYLNSLLNTVGDAIFTILMPGQRIEYVNRAVADMLGYQPEELMGQTTRVLYPSDAAFADYGRRLQDAFAQGNHSVRAESELVRKDGSRLWGDVNTTFLLVEGELHRVISVLRDITERRQSEADRIARQAAEQANQAKSDFLAKMSHEIRTPLNAVIGFARILERDASLAPRQAEMVHTITRSGRHLLNLINDILDMSKIEAGRLELSPADFCLHDLLEDLGMMFRSRAQAKQLQLLMERDDSVPRYVTADGGKLRQVLINLMGNAVKFTKTGGVVVRVRAEAEPGGAIGETSALRLVVEVEDSGPGIAEEDLDHIFEPFRQSAEDRGAGGTGLGLTVSRRLVELMGGSLTVKSRVGKGSCFRFEALVTSAEGPAKEEARETRQVIGLEPGTGPFRILVADDQKDSRDLLSALLAPLGFEIREAANGQETLQVFEEWTPHAVLMDMRMPVMDGYEATRRIKATEQGRTTPVIAVTASAFKDAEKEVLATGVDGYVRKPFRPEEILDVLGKCLGLRYVYAEGDEQAPEKARVRPFTREDLAALPEKLLQAMRQAVQAGDMAGLKTLIARIEEKDAGAARRLRNLADQYDYETLIQVLTKQEGGLSNE